MTTANIGVTVSNYQRNPGTSNGTMTFTLSGPNVDPTSGNISLNSIQDQVMLQFNLAMGSNHGPPNVAWAGPATDAIWIAPYNPSLPNQCPTQADNGLTEFGTPTTPNGNLLKINDLNADNDQYMYMLRTVVNDGGTQVTCSHDPMIINR